MKNQEAAATNQSAPLNSAPFNMDWFVTSWFVILHLIALIGPFYLFSWGAVATGFALYIVTGMLGITLGYHRLLTHRSFKSPRWVERVLATCGVLALQGSPLDWVAGHRMHHSFVDDGKDPHNARRGFWWSHIGWMCRINPDIRDRDRLKKFARDVVADGYLNWLTGAIPQLFIQIATGLILLAVGGWSYVVWGIFVRLAVTYHVTWFVNSASHKFGYRNFETGDLSTNCWWVGILAFGEGWHNNHHAYPDVARAGLKWWEFDLTYMTIRLMKVFGLAYDIKLPTDKATAEPVTLIAEEPAPAEQAVI